MTGAQGHSALCKISFSHTKRGRSRALLEVRDPVHPQVSHQA